MFGYSSGKGQDPDFGKHTVDMKDLRLKHLSGIEL